jgi:tetratricopeptide (TPR) repeat protein
MKKYIPNLIPEQHRVLPEYFKQKTYKQPKDSWSVLMWLISASLLLFAIIVLPVNIGLGFCILFTTVLICPLGHRFLEYLLHFTFTKSLRLKFIGILTVFSLFLSPEYIRDLKVLRQKEFTTKVNLEKKKQEENIRVLLKKKEVEANEKKRIDSLTFYISQAKTYRNNKKYSNAIKFYLTAQKYSVADDKDIISLGLANSYFENKNYKKALESFAGSGGNDADTYYKKGICSKKVGNISDAIRNFKQASDLGDKKSEKEYNQVNPIIRHILYYQTVCCDGSYSPSNAKGRGACSHHGGVCNWNKPIYEEHRKYDESTF